MPNATAMKDIRFTRGLFHAYLLLLFLAPLPLGSNRPVYWALLATASGSLALVWVLGHLAGVARWPRSLHAARWPLWALGLFSAWSALQLLPGTWLPSGAVPLMLAEGYRMADVPARLTADFHASADALLLTLSLFLLAALTVVLVRSRRRALLVLTTLMLAGLVQALYGSFMMLSGLEYGFLEPKAFNRGVATGTFINRNHYANLLILSLAAGLGLMLSQMNLRGQANMRQRLVGMLRAALGPKALLRAALVIMVIALVLSRSRMGNVAFFGALTVVGLLALGLLRRPSRPVLALVVSVLVIDVLVIGTWFGTEEVIDRLQRTVSADHGQAWVVADRERVDTHRESLSIVRQAPLTGWGGGVFYTVYPAWRGSDQMFLDHAHNDYLEFLVGYGFLGGGLLAIFLVSAFWRAASHLRHLGDAGRFGIGFAAAVAIVAMLIHASVDFSLQIPANAAWFVVLCLLPFCRAPGNMRHS